VALDLLRKGVIDATQLTALAIDEVDAVLCGGPFEHRLSSAGESLLEALDVPTTTLCAPPRRQSLLATAHLTPAHEAALRGRFGAYTRVEQRSEGGRRPGTLVPSLKQVFHYTSGSKDEKLLTVLRRARADEWLRDGATLVFCANGATVERLRAVVMEAEKAYSEAELSTLPHSHSHSYSEAELSTLSPPSPPPPRPLLPPLPPLILHEGLADDERHAALSALRRSAADADVEAPSRAPRVLIATSVVARGLDVPGLRHVILYDMPTDIAGYVHCAGRTARGGRPGLVSCLVESHSQAGRFRELHALTRAPALHFGG
jgi:superfamily II DNA/RNA helicase